MSSTLNQEKIGVVLLNLGGPARVEDVRPFLYNLFSDRMIIRLGPSFMQKPLAWWIAKRRAPKSQEYYRKIGGGSPLNKITAEQGRALEKELSSHGNFKVSMAMRYWKPYAETVLTDFVAQGISKIVALTLYPHYSIATTGSSLRDLKEKNNLLLKPIDIAEIDSWQTEPDYIDCLVQRVKQGVSEAPERTEVVYSAHSLPVKFINEGDPYLKHLKETIAAIEQRTGVVGHLCFQSRSGPVEWLSPSTPETIDMLAKNGCRRILMVPISFVSDHVETLCEIDIQYKEQAVGLGMEFARTSSLNTDPTFIGSLKRLVARDCRAKGWI